MSHTHDLTFDGPLVVKRYASWDRGEHRREWAVLRLVNESAPDLGPRPVAADLDATPPVVRMSLVPGAPLALPLTGTQTRALAAAITALWRVPAVGVPDIEGWHDDLAFARLLTDGPRPVGGVAADAYDAAMAWWDGPDPVLLSAAPKLTVLGHRDPNVSNYLWDGERVRIVDLEDARASDPATELAIMLEHLSWRGTDEALLRGCFEVDERRLLAARRLWAMFWLRLLLPGGPAAPRNPSGTADAQARRLLALLS